MDHIKKQDIFVAPSLDADKRQNQDNARPKRKRAFNVLIGGVCLQAIEAAAKASNVSAEDTMRELFVSFLDVHACPIYCASAMYDAGASEDEVAAFLALWSQPSQLDVVGAKEEVKPN